MTLLLLQSYVRIYKEGRKCTCEVNVKGLSCLCSLDVYQMVRQFNPLLSKMLLLSTVVQIEIC